LLRDSCGLYSSSNNYFWKETDFVSPASMLFLHI
jgi:hypothetical protein